MGKGKKIRNTVVALILSLIIIAISFIATRYTVKNHMMVNSAKYEEVNASTTEDGRFEYKILSDGTVEVTKYIGTDTEVIIPEVLKGKLVTSIGTNAFSECSSLTSVIIPEGVMRIGWFAFFSCTSLTNVIIPEGVTSIGGFAFFSCTSLTSVIIPAGVMRIEDNTFSECSSLTSVIIPEGVTSIGGWAFSSCSSLTSIIIPEGVTIISGGAFELCSKLMSINIPEGVTSISESVFRGCSSLNKIDVDINNQKYADIDGVLFNKDKEELHIYPAGKEEREYIIPEGVTSIRSDAFLECSNLTSVIIPKGVTSIGSNAFLGCSNLTSVIIPEGVMSIGKGAFCGCSSLNKIDVDINNQKYTAIDGVLFNKDKKELHIYPAGKAEREYIIPEGVTSIRSDAFWGCSNLTSVIIPEEVTSIGEDAYGNCFRLTIYCKSNSIALTYAQDNNIEYIVDDDKPTAGTLTMKISSSDGNEYTNDTWTEQSVYILLNNGDDKNPGSGHKSTTYKINEGEESTGEQIITKPGEYTIVVTTKDNVGNTSTNEYKVKIRKVESILVTKNPEKFTYNAHENFNPNGIIVSIKYNNGDIEETTEYTIKNGKQLTCQSPSIEIQYKQNPEIYTELILNVEHDLEQPTCIEDAKCKVDGCAYIKEESKLGHSFTNYASNKDATCTKDGTKTAKCERCDVTDTKIDEGSKLEHNYQSEACIQCGEKEHKLQIKSEKLNINELYITNIQANTTIEQLKQNIKTNAEEINVYNKQHEKQENNKELATGMKVEFKFNNEVKTLTIVVKGDVNGDGKIKLTDMTMINRHRLNKKMLEGESLFAADVTGDGKVNFLDLVKLNRRRLNKITVL